MSKMKNLLKPLSLMSLLIFVSCEINFLDLKVEGLITDSNENSIANLAATICLEVEAKKETKKDCRDIVTDKNGKFETRFNVNFESKYESYISYLVFNEENFEGELLDGEISNNPNGVNDKIGFANLAFRLSQQALEAQKFTYTFNINSQVFNTSTIMTNSTGNLCLTIDLDDRKFNDDILECAQVSTNSDGRAQTTIVINSYSSLDFRTRDIGTFIELNGFGGGGSKQITTSNPTSKSSVIEINATFSPRIPL
jgi:hypothetical protein